MADELVYEVFRKCGCCDRCVPEPEWDGLYSSCGDCAWCASLEHFEPCHHGGCKDATPPVTKGEP
jgi:hypothetical protein